jgi:integrase/recombinase XerC
MNPTAQDWIKNFIVHLNTERRLSAHTSTAYAHDLGEFIAYCAKQNITAWTELDNQHIRLFAAAEHRRGIGPRSIQRRLSSLRSFFNYLIREAQLKINPALEIRAPRAAKRLPVTIDADQMARLLQFRADAELDKRDKAIMELFYSSGLRLAELVNLNCMDMDLADRTVRVLGKGSKTRVLPIGRYAVSALQEWLRQRRLLQLQDADAVFVSARGKRLTPRAIQLRVAGWARKQGLGQHVHPHLFRHSFASHLLESSQDLRGVQELLGHANISSTQVYTHLDFQHLAKIYDAAHPRARSKA